MSITSFNPIHSNQFENNHANNPLTIKQGQVFHGTIKKLYPDQTAEVQIGNHKMIAKLEVPLKAGDSYFFQVKNVEPQIELSLVSNSTANLSPKQQLAQLLESMNLPKNAEVQQLLGYFLKNQIPVVKEQILEAMQWMKALPAGVTKEEALLALQKMITNKMPFQQNVFQGLIFGTKTGGFLQDIEQFFNTIAKENTIPDDIKTALSNQLQKIAAPFEGEIGGEVLKRALQTLQNQNVQNDVKQEVLNLLKEANILPKSATLQNWQMTSFNQITQQSNTVNHHANQIVQMIHLSNMENIEQTIASVKEWIQNLSVTQEQKNELINLLNNFQKVMKNDDSIKQFAQIFHQKLMTVFSNKDNNQLFTFDKNNITAKEHLLSLIKQLDGQEDLNSSFMKLAKVFDSANNNFAVKSIYIEAEHFVQSAFDGKAVHFALKTVLENLGVSYEAKLLNSEMDTISNTLKPQLLSLIQQHDVSQNIKDSAEALLSRLNGMQLASSEQNHQQQLIMQIPLQFFGKKMDATVQWNGRMKENGKIDANYARVLFYLNMETLKETIVDMQVQNRIVTIQIYNQNTNLELIAEPLKKSLKEGLQKLEYHLSGIFFKQFQNEEPKQKKKREEDEHTGVDIRI